MKKTPRDIIKINAIFQILTDNSIIQEKSIYKGNKPILRKYHNHIEHQLKINLQLVTQIYEVNI